MERGCVCSYIGFRDNGAQLLGNRAVTIIVFLYWRHDPIATRYAELVARQYRIWCNNWCLVGAINRHADVIIRES